MQNNGSHSLHSAPWLSETNSQEGERKPRHRMTSSKMSQVDSCYKCLKYSSSCDTSMEWVMLTSIPCLGGLQQSPESFKNYALSSYLTSNMAEVLPNLHVIAWPHILLNTLQVNHGI